MALVPSPTDQLPRPSFHRQRPPSLRLPAESQAPCPPAPEGASLGSQGSVKSSATPAAVPVHPVRGSPLSMAQQPRFPCTRQTSAQGHACPWSEAGGHSGLSSCSRGARSLGKTVCRAWGCRAASGWSPEGRGQGRSWRDTVPFLSHPSGSRRPGLSLRGPRTGMPQGDLKTGCWGLTFEGSSLFPRDRASSSCEEG